VSFSIIIPSKSASNLVPCIRAIREAGETARIIVVDDFPYPLPDGFSWQESGLDLSRDIVTTGADPFVFARNVNIGIKTAGTDDVVLLNDDALLKTPRGFTALSDASVRYRPTTGAMAAACDTVGNPNQFRHNPKIIDGMEYWAIRDEPRMACFVCVYIPRTTINAVGLLDERFVEYGLEDDDYCLRVRQAGLKLGIFDGCFVDHASLKSSFRGGAQAGGDFHPNLRRFIEKWGVDNWGRGRDTSEFANLFPR
jgi:GT2 family glycosyltransferase